MQESKLTAKEFILAVIIAVVLIGGLLAIRIAHDNEYQRYKAYQKSQEVNQKALSH